MANERFEGLYGRLYTGVIRGPAIRRAAFTLWGSADPLLRLETIIGAAAEEAPDGTILDVPCGGGTILPLLADTRFAGHVIESDLADAMMRRARDTLTSVPAPRYRTSFIQADARDLPLDPASVDTVISVNGLHVIPRPERFLAEFARVLRPGGRVSLITPVTSTGLRNRMILGAAERLWITPGPPPTLDELHQLLEAAGFEIAESLGGTSITGLVATRMPSSPAP